MAENINPIATGLDIGKGEAQVFDTTGLAGQAITRRNMLAKTALQEKEKKEKELLESIVNIDTSKVHERDLGMYNEKWENYRNYVKTNYKALQNPSKNVAIHQEKLRLEQEMLQFVNASDKAQKAEYDLNKWLLANPDKAEDILNQYESWKNSPGNFENPWDYFTTKPEDLSVLLKNHMNTALAAYDKNSVYEKDGVKYLEQGSSPEKWDEVYSSLYDTNEKVRKSAERAWQNAGGTESGYNDAKSYMLAEAGILRPKIKTSKTDTQKGGLSWTFAGGSGGGGTFGDLNFSSDYEGLVKDPISQEVTTQGKRKLLIRKGGKNLPYQEMSLQYKAGEDPIVQKVAIQDIIEVGDGRYELRVRVPIASKASKEQMDAIDRDLSLLASELMVAKKKEKKAIQEKIEAKQAERDKLLATTDEYEVRSVPLDNTTNKSQVETTLQITDFYKTIPKLLTTESWGGHTTKFNG